jgi:hypothetical protein
MGTAEQMRTKESIPNGAESTGRVASYRAEIEVTERMMKTI